LFPGQPSRFPDEDCWKRIFFFLDPISLKLALDDLIDQKTFFENPLRERFFSCQIDVSAKYQKDTEKEREEITHPLLQSSSPVWSFRHSIP